MSIKIYGTQEIAQQFSFPMTASLNRVNLSLARDVSSAPVTSNIIIQIQENDTVNNIPNGSIVTTAIDNFTDSGYKNFYFTDMPLIKGGDKYWIVASAFNADVDNAYNWASSANTDVTRYRATGSTWTNSTTTAQNMSAFVPHDRFNYQQYQGTQSVVENFSGGNDFYVVDKQTDMERIFNDITMVGRGDGINQVSARSLDSASINTYGRRQQKIEDKSLTTASDCQCVADTLISKYKDPVTVFDLQMTDPNIEADVGDKVAIFSDIRDINSESYRVISTEDYADMFEDGIKFNLNNAKTSIITDIDKIKKDKDLQNTYGQGATNLFQLSEEDNCDDSNGLKVLFYIPDEAKSINSVKMRWSRKPFRGYSLATKGGGGVTETTTNEGGFSQTSAGDISPITINTFSRAVENQGTTSAPISSIIAIEPPQNFYPGTGTTFGYTQMSGFFTNQTGYQRCVCAQLCVYCRTTSSFIAYLGNYGSTLNNKQTMYYNVYTNTQYDENNDWLTSYHDVAAYGIAPSDIVGISAQSALNHTHIVTVTGHTHQVTLPDHTHQIDYGIYTPGSEDIVQIDLYVDTTGGTPVHTFTGVTVDTSYPADIELSAQITTTGWHYIYLKPTYESGAAGTNSDARLQANAYVQIYIESK